jgi:hydrogenase maturation protease
VSNQPKPPAAGDRPAVLILGLGNVLFGDDGLGIDAIARLQRDYRVPPDIRIEDGGTLGLSLLALLAEAERLILVDAVRTDDRPGTLVRLDGMAAADAARDRLSPHQVGVADLLDAARLIDCYPQAVTLLGLVPEALQWSVGRSTAVNDGMDALVQAVVREVKSLGYDMVRHAEPVGGHPDRNDPARHFGM